PSRLTRAKAVRARRQCGPRAGGTGRGWLLSPAPPARARRNMWPDSLLWLRRPHAAVWGGGGGVPVQLLPDGVKLLIPARLLLLFQPRGHRQHHRTRLVDAGIVAIGN